MQKIFIVIVVLLFCIPSETIGRTIENFNTVNGWNILKPIETRLNLSTKPGFKGKCLLLDYDLSKKKLYVVISKNIKVKLPRNYKFIFYIKGISPNNNLEFKIVDKNENTFWKKWDNFRFTDNWRKITVKKDDISFAWGPKAGEELTEIKRIEFALSSGAGGKGKVYIDEISLIELPAPPKVKEILKNSSFEKGLNGWKKSGNAKYMELHDWHHYEGKWSFGIGNDNGPDNASGEIYQEIKVPGGIKKGDIVIFNMRLTGEDKYTGQASLKIQFLDKRNKLLKSYQSRVLTGKFDWTKLIVSGEAPQDANKVIVKCVSKKMKSGKGGTFLWIDNAGVDIPIITASSILNGKYLPKNIMAMGKWHSKHKNNQWIKINFRQIKKFTGLSIDWGNDYAEKYEIFISLDGKKWDLIYNIRKNIKGVDKIYLDETYAKFLKIKCKNSKTEKGFGIKSIEMMEPSGLVSLKNFYKIMAAQHPEYFPRWMINKQAYWTIVGVERDTKEAIICEDGTIEPFKRGFTITPFVYQDNKLNTRDDVKMTQSLEKIYLPIPAVQWNQNNFKLNIKMFSYGEENKSTAYVIYTIENIGNKNINGSLFLCVRPFQVYPPWQGGTDGFANIFSINYKNKIINIDNKYKIISLTKPNNFGAIKGSEYFKFPFKIPSPPELKGDITGFIRKGILPDKKSVQDGEGFASGAVRYDYDLRPGEKKEIFIMIPFHKKSDYLSIKLSESEVKDKYDKMLKERIAYWKSKIDNVDINIPEMDLVNLMKANIGYNLITMDGPYLQPGARSYDKAWWRDGSIQASSLLKVGLKKEPRDFFENMLSFQYDTGEVPPIIDNKADDPLWEEKPPHNLKEYDSQGEMIAAALEYYHFSGNIKFLKDKWKNIYKSLRFLEKLRNQRLTNDYNNIGLSEKRFYGILPQSRSHEGYWFAHSYWDDWWAIKGWKDGLKIAKILKKRKSVIKWIEKNYNDFWKTLTSSIKATAKFFKVNYISGAADKGDFDPTSTAVAISYCGEVIKVKKYLGYYLKNTFDRYWNEIKGRLKQGANYNYTPYEARNVPAFLYMGEKRRALALLRFLLKGSRPYKWFQLAEVVNSDYRLNYYVGDIPHTWVGAELINAIRSLFVYEEDDTLILGAGVDEKWLERKAGISVKNMPTYFGKINYSMNKQGNVLKIKITGNAKPKHGFILKSPFLNKTIKNVKVNNKKWKKFTDKEILFNKLPAKIVMEL